MYFSFWQSSVYMVYNFSKLFPSNFFDHPTRFSCKKLVVPTLYLRSRKIPDLCHSDANFSVTTIMHFLSTLLALVCLQAQWYNIPLSLSVFLTRPREAYTYPAAIHGACSWKHPSLLYLNHVRYFSFEHSRKISLKKSWSLESVFAGCLIESSGACKCSHCSAISSHS